MSSWLQYNSLFNACVCIWIQFRNPAFAQSCIVNSSLSDFNLWTWYPSINFSNTCLFIPNAPIWTALILFESSVDNQIIAPTGNANFLRKDNVTDGNLMILFIGATNSTESNSMNSFVGISLNFDSFFTITRQDLVNGFSIKSNKNSRILDRKVWKNSVIETEFELTCFKLIWFLDAFARMWIESNSGWILDRRLVNWRLINWRLVVWW